MKNMKTLNHMKHFSKKKYSFKRYYHTYKKKQNLTDVIPFFFYMHVTYFYYGKRDTYALNVL